MGRIKKSTRKFEKNHLKDTLERRKDFAKIKQRYQAKAKKKAKNGEQNGGRKTGTTNDEDATGGVEANGPGVGPFGDMSVEDFFQGGFEVTGAKSGKTKSTKNASTGTGKRKRIEIDDGDNGDDGGSSVTSHEDVAASTASGSESSAGYDFDTHKGDLDALAEKDPEFYNFLKENDAELLGFTADNGGHSETEDAPQKKRTKLREDIVPDDEDDETEVTNAMVDKWRVALTENNSLRAMRQVVLAFRAAAHVNEDDGKEYKYTISDSDGMLYKVSRHGRNS